MLIATADKPAWCIFVWNASNLQIRSAMFIGILDIKYLVTEKAHLFSKSFFCNTLKPLNETKGLCSINQCVRNV